MEQDAGFRVWSAGFRSLGCRAFGAGVRVSILCRVHRGGSKMQGLWRRRLGLESRV